MHWPTLRRKATIALHWAVLVLLVLLVAGGPVPLLGWAFGLCGLGMGGLALMFGLLNGPGPKLSGTLRHAHPWLSRGMYIALAWVSANTLWSLLGGDVYGPPLASLYFYLMAGVALHAISHLWRHTALMDGALRRITPASLHGML